MIKDNSFKCYCGSGKRFNRCCKPRIDKIPFKNTRISPPEAHTGFSHPGCFLSSTNDCGEKISREHYISASVLSEIDDIINLEGVSWLPPKKPKKLRISSLTSKVLCQRHNESLSPLDKNATEFFRALKNFTQASFDGPEKVIILNGRDLERWMLKAIYGLLTSKSLQQQYGISIQGVIDKRCVELLYDLVPFEKGRGLFIRTAYPGPMPAKRHLMVKPLLKIHKRTLQGMEFNVLGYDFLLTTCPINVEGGEFRPGYILFSSSTGTKVICLKWPDPGPHPIIQALHNPNFKKNAT